MDGQCLTDIELEDEFFKLQARMIDVGTLKGLTHPETIKYSQELDIIINHFQKVSSPY